MLINVGYFIITMEYFENQTLKRYIENKTLSQVCGILLLYIIAVKGSTTWEIYHGEPHEISVLVGKTL